MFHMIPKQLATSELDSHLFSTFQFYMQPDFEILICLQVMLPEITSHKSEIFEFGAY